MQELGTTCRNFLVAGTCVVVWWMDCFVFMFYAFVWKHDEKLIMVGMYGLLWLECDYNIIMQMVVYIL